MIFMIIGLSIMGGSTKTDEEEPEGEIRKSLKESGQDRDEDKMIMEGGEDNERKSSKSKKRHNPNHEFSDEEEGERHRKEAIFPISSATIMFQALMILSAMYLSMLCTNWGSVSIFDDTTDFFSHGTASYWLKLVAEWASMGLYVFSLVAPILPCFRNRNF